MGRKVHLFIANRETRKKEKDQQRGRTDRSHKHSKYRRRVKETGNRTRKKAKETGNT